MTAAVWIRGFLNDDYGVRARTCTGLSAAKKNPAEKNG